MTTSNIKFRTGLKEAPTEPFKRAVTACLRAIARTPELEVSFAAERPGVAPGKVRLPGNPIKMAGMGKTISRPAPMLDEHTDAVLQALLNLSADEVAMLRKTGAVGHTNKK